MTGSYSRYHTLAGHRAQAKHTLLNLSIRVFIPFVNDLILYSYHTECFISALNCISRFQANEYLVLLRFRIRIAVTNTDFIPYYEYLLNKYQYFFAKNTASNI